MKLTGVGPSGELGDQIELAEQLAHHLARIVALTELLELPHDARERFLSLQNRDLGVVLPLSFEALMMFEELFPEKIGEARAGGTTERSQLTRGVDVRQTSLQGHL